MKGKKNINELIPVKKMITRNGKTYQTTVYVRQKDLDKVDHKSNVEVPDWSNIATLEDFDKARKMIFSNQDTSTKDALKNEFVDFMERSGVKWEKCEDSNINYMRCMMKAKKQLAKGEFVAEGSGKKRIEKPFKEMDKTEARRIVQSITKYIDREKIYALMKEEGITWNESDHAGINHMRAMVSLREHLEEGNGFKLVNNHLKKNPNYTEADSEEDAKHKEIMTKFANKDEDPMALAMPETPEEMSALKREMKETEGKNTKEKLEKIHKKYFTGVEDTEEEVDILDYEVGEENLKDEDLIVQKYPEHKPDRATAEAVGKTIFVSKETLKAFSGRDSEEVRRKLDFIAFHEIGHVLCGMYTGLQTHVLSNPNKIFGTPDKKNNKFIPSLKEDYQVGCKWNPNGEEVFCDAHALYLTDPEKMEKDYPELFKFFKDLPNKVPNYNQTVSNLHEQYKKVIGELASEQNTTNPFESTIVKGALPQSAIDPIERPYHGDYPEGKKDPQYKKDREEYRKRRDARNEAIDKAVDEYIEQVGEPIFKTKEEVLQWGDDLGIEIMDDLLDFVDLRLFNDIKPILEDTFKRYPQLNGVEHDGTLYKFRLGKEDDGGGFMSAGNGIYFSSTFKDYKEAVYSALYNIGTGFNVYGDGTIKTLFHHEMGHNFEFSIHDEERFQDEWNKDGSLKIGGAEKRVKFERDWYIPTRQAGGESEYSHTNEGEMFAEAYAEIKTSKNPKPFAVTFQKILRDQYGVDI